MPRDPLAHAGGPRIAPGVRAGHGHVQAELAGQVLAPRAGEQQPGPHRPPGREPPRAPGGRRLGVSVVEHGGGRQQQAVVERHPGQPEDERAARGVRAAVAEPAGHPDLAARLAVGAERLAQAEHAGRGGDAADAPARIPGCGKQAEQLRVGEDAALGVDVPGDRRVGAPVVVEIDRLPVEVDVHVAVPGDPGERGPVVAVGVDEGRARVSRAGVLVRPDVLDGPLAIARAGRPRPGPGIDHVVEQRLHRRVGGRRRPAPGAAARGGSRRRAPGTRRSRRARCYAASPACGLET